ncbi:uncharacterized protein LOC122367953 [Amphibalanus amphitrite]|uniref:uncharacterized protein LOC122367953 n=1 Tax=Amphibalanus amphitrite TaxID=1232801 RepID=UPI001C904EED|nr:uncharacterized protein LOC122367953 [Amphibalanus amphitrite]XP_043197446.1 uncharacterized protein LOC122367953 [Amphibalanus amphitrite]
MDSPDSSFSVIIQHMGKKESVALPADITLGDFQRTVEDMTHVPVAAQKVVHKGRDLARHESDVTLQDCRVKNKDIVMILGLPVDPVNDETLAAIAALETQSEAVITRLDDIQKDLDGARKGFLPARMAAEVRPKLEKRLLTVSEELMRLLERLDSISVGQSSESARRKRKAVVTAINAQMDRADKLKEKLAEIGS